MDRQNLYNPMPDYLIIDPPVYSERSIRNQYDYLNVLLNPNDPKVPNNFEVIFKSETGTLVYKIHHNG